MRLIEMESVPKEMVALRFAQPKRCQASWAICKERFPTTLR